MLSEHLGENPNALLLSGENSNPKELEEMISLYNTYEFSPNVLLLADSAQYGTLFNYIKLGLLTADELVEALAERVPYND